MRIFVTGATRDDDTDKLDYGGFLSPYALEAYAQYMHQHRIQADGQVRASDNWKKGIPQDEYMRSLFRHFMDVWIAHDVQEPAQLKTALCALFFNVQGLLHEVTRP